MLLRLLSPFVAFVFWRRLGLGMIQSFQDAFGYVSGGAHARGRGPALPVLLVRGRYASLQVRSCCVRQPRSGQQAYIS